MEFYHIVLAIIDIYKSDQNRQEAIQIFLFNSLHNFITQQNLKQPCDILYVSERLTLLFIRENLKKCLSQSLF